MSLQKCIPGYIPSTDRRMLEEAADRWERHTGDRGRAEVAALNSRLQTLEENRRAAILSANAEARIASRLDSAGNRPGEMLEAHIRTSPRGVASDLPSADVEQHIAETTAWTRATAFRELAADTPAREARQVGDDVAREIGGIATGNAKAKEAAESLRQSFDWLRGEFNRLGGSIKFRGNFLFPQSWDAAGIADAGGRDAWIARLATRYETPGVMDPLVGPHGAPLEGDELRAALGGMADSILAGRATGTIGRVPGAVRTRHLDPRAISYRDVNARLEDAAEFGSPDIFETARQHIQAMSSEIGAMRVFGPNPALAYANARERVRLAGYGGRGPSSETKLTWLDDTFRQMMGDSQRPASAGIAKVGRGVRSVMGAGLLPLSLASQFSDIVPVSLVSSLYRIPAMQSVTNGLRQVVGAGLTKAELSRIGVVVDGMIAHMANSGTLDAAGWSRWLSEKSMRFYGIKAWAEGMQAGMEATMLGRLADLSGRGFTEADEALGGNLTRLGWTPEAWDTVRTHGLEEIGGSRFASVGALDAADIPEDARREAIQRLVYTSRRFSSVGMTLPDSKTLAMMSLGTQAGTLAGEAARSATQFKTFGTQFFLNQLGQIMQLPTAHQRIGYGAKVLAGTAMLGLVSLQTKRLLKGQELAEMDPTTEQGRWLLPAAIAQGGGFGIVGDFFKTATQESRFGHGLITTLAGPSFGALEDAAALTLGNVGQVARGEQANFGSEAVRLGGRYVPFVNAPFMGVAFQRLVVDQARLWADPSGSRRSFMSMEQRQRDEFASKYWWKPGETLPEALR